MLTTLAGALGALATLPLAPSHDALDLVPPDAFVVGHVESIAELHAAVAASDYYQFFMASDGLLLGSGLLDDLEAETGTDLAALFELLGSTELESGQVEGVPEEALRAWQFVRDFEGSLTVYAHGEPTDGGSVGYGVVMEPGGSMETFVERLEGLFDQPPVWRDRGGLEVATETADPFEQQNAFVAAGERHLVFVGSDLAPVALAELDRVAARLAGAETPRLADNPRWVEAAAATAGLGQARVFVDLGAVMGAIPLDELEGTIGDDVAAPVSPGEVLEDSGVLGMRWLAARMFVGAGETFSLDVEVHVPEEGFVTRLLDLGAGGVPTRFLQRFDEGVLRAQAMRFDVAGAVDLALDLVGRYAGDGAAEIEMQLEQLPAMLGFDPVEDLLRQMSGEFAVVETPAPPTDDVAQASPFALLGVQPTFVVGLRDPLRFEDAVWSAIAFAESMGEQPLPVEELEVGGRAINRVAMPEGEVFFGFGHDAMAMGFDRAAVARALSPVPPDARSAMDDPNFSRAFDRHPDAMAIEVVRTGAYFGTMLEALGGVSMLAAMSGEEVPPQLAAMAQWGDRARERFRGHTTQVFERTARGVRLHVGSR